MDLSVYSGIREGWRSVNYEEYNGSITLEMLEEYLRAIFLERSQSDTPFFINYPVFLKKQPLKEVVIEKPTKFIWDECDYR